MITTLNAIRQHSPCKEGWEKLLRHLGKTFPDDDPLPILTILTSNGLDDALWCLRAVGGCDREIRLLAVKFARRVQALMNDGRSIRALTVAEDFANGRLSDKQLNDARLNAGLAVLDSIPFSVKFYARAAAHAVVWHRAWDAARLAAIESAYAASQDREIYAQEVLLRDMIVDWQNVICAESGR